MSSNRPYEGLGECIYELFQDKERACIEFEKATRIDVNNADLHVSYGCLLEKMGDVDRAEDEYRRY